MDVRTTSPCRPSWLQERDRLAPETPPDSGPNKPAWDGSELLVESRRVLLLTLTLEEEPSEVEEEPRFGSTHPMAAGWGGGWILALVPPVQTRVLVPADDSLIHLSVMLNRLMVPAASAERTHQSRMIQSSAGLYGNTGGDEDWNEGT